MTITAGSASMTHGGAMPATTTGYSGFVCAVTATRTLHSCASPHKLVDRLERMRVA